MQFSFLLVSRCMRFQYKAYEFIRNTWYDICHLIFFYDFIPPKTIVFQFCCFVWPSDETILINWCVVFFYSIKCSRFKATSNAHRTVSLLGFYLQDFFVTFTFIYLLIEICYQYILLNKWNVNQCNEYN